MTDKGVIAGGHTETVGAAAIILEEGGNAFDAALAAFCTACVCEPVLASLGGGGFLMARDGQDPVLYDFFVQTPKQKTEEAELFPIIADFGTALQEFHIGAGSMATPGAVKGMFRIHRDLCSMPLARIIEPAVALAREGVTLNRFQAYILDVVHKIYERNEACRDLMGSRLDSFLPMGEGEKMKNPDLAATFEALACEGEDLFYRGEMAQALDEFCRHNAGALRLEDLADYEVILRKPLEVVCPKGRIYTNPPPAAGGILIAFAIELLKGCDLETAEFGSSAHLESLLRAMDMTNKARLDSRLHEAGEDACADLMLSPDFIKTYKERVLGRPEALSGTTQISVIDAKGRAASMTLSNGEGSGIILPGCGVIMNNMLGEEDINPHGFGRWPEDKRMCSMMAPSLIVADDGWEAALGSGGSNRIRTAILQVVLNLLDFSMDAKEAVEAPRIHFEKGLLSVEAGFSEERVTELSEISCDGGLPEIEAWAEQNLFFGGVHTALFDPRAGRFEGAGDPRRGGVCVTV
jgi:gamma-glutamyltranspeptidase / glutathione hydrolase